MTTSCSRLPARVHARLLAGVALAMATAWGGGALAARQAATPASSAVQAAPAARAMAVFPDRTVVSLEVARTEPERNRGLMLRKSMPENAGMIFLFDQPGIYPFWMKDTLIPLDMFWTDTSGRVVWIAESVPPCTADPCPQYPPKAVASYVIETNAGFAKKHRVKVGDLVSIQGLTK